ncbi:hypothetical protein DDE05_04675 [Streptomyces cavourensis]|jgi:hypothetical protein|uniref:hypothetical protein n=1 Tax=unclassified Achromobacter TaxID=2626865 RepID=UPI000E04EAC3|nr:hypothetical protein DDE05_04675 [Streptomyces cavourensis]
MRLLRAYSVASRTIHVRQQQGDALRRMEGSTALNTTDLSKSVVLDIQGKVLYRSRPGLMEELRVLSAISA